MLNYKNIQEFIKEHDITFISVRFINEKDIWCSINFTAVNFDYTLLNNFIYNKIKLVNFNFIRSFVDPFVAHKTLVLMANIDKIDYKPLKLSKLQPYLQYKFSLYNNQNNFNTTIYASPDNNPYADLIGEIVQSLMQMKVEVVNYHTEDNKNTNLNTINFTINIIKSNNNSENMDNLIKTKYAIQMVCNLYKVSIHKNQI